MLSSHLKGLCGCLVAQSGLTLCNPMDCSMSVSDHKQKNKTTPMEIDAQWHKAKAQNDMESDMDMM